MENLRNKLTNFLMISSLSLIAGIVLLYVSTSNEYLRPLGVTLIGLSVIMFFILFMILIVAPSSLKRIISRKVKVLNTAKEKYFILIAKNKDLRLEFLDMMFADNVSNEKKLEILSRAKEITQEAERFHKRCVTLIKDFENADIMTITHANQNAATLAQDSLDFWDTIVVPYDTDFSALKKDEQELDAIIAKSLVQLKEILKSIDVQSKDKK
jgi:hypothetical protein